MELRTTTCAPFRSCWGAWQALWAHIPIQSLLYIYTVDIRSLTRITPDRYLDVWPSNYLEYRHPKFSVTWPSSHKGGCLLLIRYLRSTRSNTEKIVSHFHPELAGLETRYIKEYATPSMWSSTPTSYVSDKTARVVSLLMRLCPLVGLLLPLGHSPASPSALRPGDETASNALTLYRLSPIPLPPLGTKHVSRELILARRASSANRPHHYRHGVEPRNGWI